MRMSERAAILNDGMSSWCHEDEEPMMNRIIVSASRKNPSYDWILACPKCGHQIQSFDQGGRINGLPGLPAGVKFDPTDQEILEHLEAKIIMEDMIKPHPLIDEFIPTLEGDDGICYTHPEKLPGVSKDGQVRHFFHRPSKAYTTGTRKRRKVHSGPDNGIETRWHKTGKTRPILGHGQIKGFKKILVLYTNYGRQKKPEKTNWVMHQYHLGCNEEEKDGELVVSKVFFQTQPRQCGATANNKKLVVPIIHHHHDEDDHLMLFGDHNNNDSHQGFNNGNGKRLLVEYNNYHDSVINPNHYVYYGDDDDDDRAFISQCLPQLIPSFAVHSAEETTPHEAGLVGIN